MFRFMALLVFSGLMWCEGVSTDLQCTSTRTKVLSFSINSYRNLTGHWVAQVRLEHGAGNKEAGPFEVDIDHTTAKCENTESVLIVATVTASPQRPGQGYDLVPGLGYYKFHTTGKTWYSAREICAQEGGHLLILNSEKEAEVIRNIWKRYPKVNEGWKNSCAFIGIHDEYTEGEYITLFGDSLNATGYTKWEKGEPGEGTAGNCGCVGRNGLLYDTNGLHVLSFFCEQEY